MRCLSLMVGGLSTRINELRERKEALQARVAAKKGKAGGGGGKAGGGGGGGKAGGGGGGGRS